MSSLIEEQYLQYTAERSSNKLKNHLILNFHGLFNELYNVNYLIKMGQLSALKSVNAHITHHRTSMRMEKSSFTLVRHEILKTVLTLKKMLT